MAHIVLPTVQSLLLQFQCDAGLLASGTGFVVDTRRGPALITCRHNVTGRNNKTHQPLSPTGGIPDKVAIFHQVGDEIGRWEARVEPLLIEGKPSWIEHPKHGASADFVALLLTKSSGIKLYPYKVDMQDPRINIAPADPVSVVGFPFGKTGGGALALWATGFVASEPEVDIEGLPMFLIDCRARPGQSGSAVIAHRNGGAILLEDGSTEIFNGPVTRFLGIYSGRINDQSDIGMVWKASAIGELVAAIT